jgi:hypothetical protein
MGKLDSAMFYFPYPTNPYPGSYNYHNYDAQGRILQLLSLGRTATGMDTTGRIDYYYNQQGQPSFDSIRAYYNGEWPAWAAVSRTYDPQGNLSLLKYDQKFTYLVPNWATRHEYHYTYYPPPGTHLKTVDYYSMQGSPSRDSMEYAGNNPIAIRQTSLAYDGTAWMQTRELVRHMNAQGLPDSIYLRYGTGQAELKEVYTYSAYGNPTQRLSFQGQPPAAYVRYRYYYEVYNDPNGITTVKPSEDIKVFPNPSNGEVTLRWKEAGARRVSMQLVNVAGQQVMNASFTLQGTDHHFSIRHLDAGIYWLVLRSEDGALLLREAVVKQ